VSRVTYSCTCIKPLALSINNFTLSPPLVEEESSNIFRLEFLKKNVFFPKKFFLKQWLTGCIPCLHLFLAPTKTLGEDAHPPPSPPGISRAFAHVLIPGVGHLKFYHCPGVGHLPTPRTTPGHLTRWEKRSGVVSLRLSMIFHSFVAVRWLISSFVD